MTKPQKTTKKGIVLFDGICNLCNASVRFLLKHEKGDALKFASLQSKFGQQLLKKYNFREDYLASVLYIDDSGIHTTSEAAIRISKHLKFPYNLFQGIRILPRPIREWIYHYIAKNRYKWFGTQNSCTYSLEGFEDKFPGN